QRDNSSQQRRRAVTACSLHLHNSLITHHLESERDAGRILWSRPRVPVPYVVPGEDLAHWNDAAARLVEVSLLRNALTSNDVPYSYDALERCTVLKLSLNSSSCFKLFRIRKAVLIAVVVH